VAQIKTATRETCNLAWGTDTHPGQFSPDIPPHISPWKIRLREKLPPPGKCPREYT